MARLKSSLELESERLETLQKLTGNYPLPTDKPALVYSRYSTAKQVRDSIAAGLQQSEKLLTRADDLGWQRALLTLLIENQMTKDGRIRSVSGTIPIDDRAGMSTVTEYVKGNKTSAILCDDISRLTRDADLVDAMTLAKMCREHDVVIVTSDRVYNFQRKGDFDAYIDEARAAASFIETHIRGKMLKNRTRKATAGKLANGVAPVGLMAVGEKRSELVPSPHASQVDWLYAEFKRHEASLTGLLNELDGMAKRGEPVFPECAEVDHLFLTEVCKDGKRIGWTIASRFGLRHVLTNPAYIGHLCFDGKVVKRNAHTAIVDADNWYYAFNHLAEFGLDGEPIVREKRTARYTQKTSGDTGALLAGCRHNGTPVITGVDGASVYVKQPASYCIQRHRQGLTAGYECAVSIGEIDRIIEEHLMYLLTLSEFKPGKLNKSMPAVMHELVKEHDANTEESQPNTTLETLKEEIDDLARHIRIGGKRMGEKELDEAYTRLERLRNRRQGIEDRQANEARVQSELRQAREDVLYAGQLWDEWDVARRRTFIHLVTESITLEEIAEGWLRLTVVWSSVLGGVVEECYIWRGNANNWSAYDLDLLRAMYPVASKTELLDMFPSRTWLAIQRQARERRVRRGAIVDHSNEDNDISRLDWQVIKQFGIGMERVQWYVVQVDNNSNLS